MDNRNLKPLFADDYRTMLWAIAFLLYGMALDMGSTLLLEHYFPLLTYEANPLVVDKTGNYLPLKYLMLNGAAIGLLLIPFAGFIGLSLRRWSFASLPFWFAGGSFAAIGSTNIKLMLHLLWQQL